MGWIILTVVFGVAFWGGIIWWSLMRAPETAATGRWGLALAGVSAVLWIVVSLGLMVHTVGQREVAIVYNFSGTITGKKDAWCCHDDAVAAHQEGEHRDPARGMVDLDSDQRGRLEGPAAHLRASSSVNYQIEPRTSSTSTRDVGPGLEDDHPRRAGAAGVQGDHGDVPDAADHRRREQLRIDTKARLAKELDEYDIHVVDVFVKNLGFSQSYTDAIEREAEAGAGRADGAGEGRAGRGRGEPEGRRRPRVRRRRTSRGPAATRRQTAAAAVADEAADPAAGDREAEPERAGDRVPAAVGVHPELRRRSQPDRQLARDGSNRRGARRVERPRRHRSIPGVPARRPQGRRPAPQAGAEGAADDPGDDGAPAAAGSRRLASQYVVATSKPSSE